MIRWLAVIRQQRMMRPGDRAARQQQDHGVDERNAERVEGVDAGGRPHQRHWRRPHVFGENRVVEERPEEADEKHDLAADEQRHAVAKAQAAPPGYADRAVVLSRSTSFHHMNMVSATNAGTRPPAAADPTAGSRRRNARRKRYPPAANHHPRRPRSAMGWDRPDGRAASGRKTAPGRPRCDATSILTLRRKGCRSRLDRKSRINRKSRPGGVRTPAQFNQGDREKQHRRPPSAPG